LALAAKDRGIERETPVVTPMAETPGFVPASPELSSRGQAIDQRDTRFVEMGKEALRILADASSPIPACSTVVAMLINANNLPAVVEELVPKPPLMPCADEQQLSGLFLLEAVVCQVLLSRHILSELLDGERIKRICSSSAIWLTEPRLVFRFGRTRRHRDADGDKRNRDDRSYPCETHDDGPRLLVRSRYSKSLMESDFRK
jgi:hypothetical protein